MDLSNTGFFLSSISFKRILLTSTKKWSSSVHSNLQLNKKTRSLCTFSTHHKTEQFHEKALWHKELKSRSIFFSLIWNLTLFHSSFLRYIYNEFITATKRKHTVNETIHLTNGESTVIHLSKLVSQWTRKFDNQRRDKKQLLMNFHRMKNTIHYNMVNYCFESAMKEAKMLKEMSESSKK